MTTEQHAALDRITEGTASEQDWKDAMPCVESILRQLGVTEFMTDVHGAFRLIFETNGGGDELDEEKSLRLAIEKFTGDKFCRTCLSFHPRGGAHRPGEFTALEFKPERKAFRLVRSLTGATKQ